MMDSLHLGISKSRPMTPFAKGFVRVTRTN